MLKISDEEYAQLDELFLKVPWALVEDWEANQAAFLLATILQDARTVYANKDQPLNETYFMRNACTRLLESNKEVLKLVKDAHTNKKYAAVRDFRECYLLILDLHSPHNASSSTI
jgi:hypothetical protein